MPAIVVGAGSGIGGLSRVGFGAMSNSAERSRTGPNVAPGGLSLRLDLVEHQVEFTPCSAAASRPEGGAAARHSIGTFRFHGLVRFLKIGFGSTPAPKKMMSPARAVGSSWIPRTRSRRGLLSLRHAWVRRPWSGFPRALDAYASAEI